MARNGGESGDASYKNSDSGVRGPKSRSALTSRRLFGVPAATLVGRHPSHLGYNLEPQTLASTRMKSLSTILTAATWITAVTAAPRSFRLPGGGRVTFEPFQSDSLSTHADELAQQAPLLSTAGMPVVDDHYIVVLKKAIDTEGLTAHHTWLAGHVSASASAIGVNEGKKARVRHLYDMNSYKGKPTLTGGLVLTSSCRIFGRI